MRYQDASHVDRGGFHARRPLLGGIYRLVGYAGLAAGVLCRGNAEQLGYLLIILLLVWFSAWYAVVGSLWRTSVVAAILLCAILLSQYRVHDIIGNLGSSVVMRS